MWSEDEDEDGSVAVEETEQFPDPVTDEKPKRSSNRMTLQQFRKIGENVLRLDDEPEAG